MARAPAANRIGLACAAAAILGMLAATLWIVGILAAGGATCPAYDQSGLDTRVSLWPPGAECIEQGTADPAVRSIEQPLAWIDEAIVGLALAAAIVLLIGIVLEIRQLRSRARPIRWTASAPPG